MQGETEGAQLIDTEAPMNTGRGLIKDEDNGNA